MNEQTKQKKKKKKKKTKKERREVSFLAWILHKLELDF